MTSSDARLGRMKLTKPRTDVGLATVGEIVTKLSGLAVMMVLTRYVPAGRLGAYFFAVSTATLCAVASAVGTTTLLNRSVAQDPSGTADYLGKVLSVRVPMLVTAYIAINGITALTSPGLLPIMLPASAYALLRDFWFTYSAVLLGSKRVGTRTALEVTAPLIQVTMIPVAAALGWSFETILLILAGSSAVMVGSAATLVHRRWGPVPVRWLGRPAWAYAVASWPFFALTALREANFRVDTMMVYSLSSPREAASYETAFKLLEVSRLLVRPLSAVFFPILAVMAAGTAWHELGRTANKLMLRTTLAGLVVAVAITAIAPWVMPTIWGPEYADSGPVLRVLYLSVPVLWLGLVASFVAAALGRERAAAIGQALSLATNLGMNAVTVPILGAVGAAWTTLATQSVLSGWLVLLVRRTLDERRRTP